MLGRWAAAMVRWRLAVFVGWAALAAAGTLANAHLATSLSTSLSVPSTSSATAGALLVSRFGQGPEGTFTVVLPVRAPSQGALDRFDNALVAVARSLPGGKAVAAERSADVLYGDISTPLGLQKAARLTPGLRASLAHFGAGRAFVTGLPALQYDITPVLDADLHRGEAFAVVIALVLLLALLGPSPSALVPLVVAFATTSTVLAAVWVLAHVVQVALYVPNVVGLLGLGLAVDYSLLLTRRFREELPLAPTVTQAVGATLGTAGRAVVVSGTAVTIGLAALIAVPVPFVRSLGLAGLLVPLASVASGLSLQPALLSLLNNHGRRDSRPARRRASYWDRVARLTVSHPLGCAAAALGVLVAASLPLGWLSLTPGSVEAIPAQMASARGLAVLRQSAGPGVITPVDVVVDSGGGGRAASPAMDGAVLRLADAVTAQPDVLAVAIGNRPPYVDRTGRYRQVVIIERSDFGAPASQALVNQLRRVLVPAALFPPGTTVYVGGAAAQGADFLSRTYGALPWVICIVVAGVYLVLAAGLRSALLPVVALSLDCLLAGAATGVAVALSHWGLGHYLFGTYQVAQLEGWVPIFLGALLFGLGTDYQVFFLTRMREAWDQGASPRRAIVEGLSRSGPVVSAAALVMAGALLGLVRGQVVGLQELGFGLIAGVVLDATVVRGALMPAIMALLGGRSWWPSHPASVGRSAPGVLSGASPGATLP